MKIIKVGLTQVSILTAIMFLNTGCMFGLFGDKPQVQTLVEKKKATPVIAKTSDVNTPSLVSIAPECSDAINAKSACKKDLIDEQELTNKEVLTNTGGEIHNLKSIQGDKVTIIERPTGYLFPEFGNKIVILEMFGKNCSHCIKEMPIMNRLHKRYRNYLEIVVLQVEGKMSTIQANALIRRHRIEYPLISGSTATNLQYHVQSTYGWTGILPFIMLIKDGVTEFTYRGEVTYKEINNDILSLLN